MWAQVTRSGWWREATGFQAWLRRRQTALGGKTVLDSFEERRLQLVVDIAEAILFGNPA